MGNGQNFVANLIGFDLPASIPARRWVILTFSIMVLIRMAIMMFKFLHRRMPWSETLAVPGAFAIYYVGFALLCLPASRSLGLFDFVGIGIFILGSWFNTWSEYQRHTFKKDGTNKGKLYTQGLFGTSMHINYFGDVLWVSAYAILTQNLWACLIPVMLFCMFAFYNIPQLDKYLAGKYGDDFQHYAATTKKFVPFIW